METSSSYCKITAVISNIYVLWYLLKLMEISSHIVCGLPTLQANMQTKKSNVSHCILHVQLCWWVMSHIKEVKAKGSTSSLFLCSGNCLKNHEQVTCIECCIETNLSVLLTLIRPVFYVFAAVASDTITVNTLYINKPYNLARGIISSNLKLHAMDAFTNDKLPDILILWVYHKLVVVFIVYEVQLCFLKFRFWY